MPAIGLASSLVLSFQIAMPKEAEVFKTKPAPSFEPMKKAVHGADSCVLFVTTDEIDGNRFYSIRACVSTKDEVEWLVPEGMKVGMYSTRKRCLFAYRRMLNPFIAFVYSVGRLQFAGKITQQTLSDMPSPTFTEAATPTASKKKPGRPKMVPLPKARGDVFKTGKLEIPLGGLTVNADLDWAYLCSNRRVRMPLEPSHTIEQLKEAHPEAWNIRRKTLIKLQEMGLLESSPEYESMMAMDLDSMSDREAEKELKEIDTKAQIEGMKREVTAPTITPKHPAGQTLIKTACIKAQHGTFTYIGEVMEWLDRMGMTQFSESEMLQIMKDRGIKIET